MIHLSRQQYLTAMGIELWQRRVVQIKPSYRCYALLQGAHRVGYVLLGALSLDDASMAKVESLLSAILTAIHLKQGELQDCGPDILTELIACQPDFLLFMGGTVVKRLLGSQYDFESSRVTPPPIARYQGITVVTYHPVDLLRDGSLKRQVWKDLQPILETRLQGSGLRAQYK